MRNGDAIGVLVAPAANGSWELARDERDVAAWKTAAELDHDEPQLMGGDRAEVDMKPTGLADSGCRRGVGRRRCVGRCSPSGTAHATVRRCRVLPISGSLTASRGAL